MRETILQLVRFGIVGISATITYFCTGMALSYLTALHPLVVHVLAFLISLAVSYLGHAHFTFGVAGTRYVIRYAIITGVLFAASSLLTVIQTQIFSLSSSLNVTIITFIYPIFSFLLHRFWTFKHPAESESHSS